MISLTSPRGRRALQLRPQVIAVAQQFGSIDPAERFPCLTAKVGEISISYRTPFQKVPRAPDTVRYMAAAFGRTADHGYGIDVWWWHPAAKRAKGLGIVWNEQDAHLEVFNYHRGDWEREIEAFSRPHN